MTVAPETDADEAMRLHAEGDGPAFQRVYAALHAPVRRFVQSRVRGDKGLEDDIVQNTFIRMHLARARFEDGGRALPWAITIARNLIVDAKRAGKRAVLENWDATPASVSAESLFVSREQAELVMEGLAALTSEQREAVWLMRVDGLSAPEAALIVGVDAVALRGRLHRATSRLRDWLEQRGTHLSTGLAAEVRS